MATKHFQDFKYSQVVSELLEETKVRIENRQDLNGYKQWSLHDMLNEIRQIENENETLPFSLDILSQSEKN